MFAIQLTRKNQLFLRFLLVIGIIGLFRPQCILSPCPCETIMNNSLAKFYVVVVQNKGKGMYKKKCAACAKLH